MSGKGGKAKGKSEGINTENQVQLSKTRYATVSEFRGKIRVDIREFYLNNEGVACPGKKGVSLVLEDWIKLKDSIDKIDEIIKKLSGDEIVEDDSSSESD